MSELDGRAAIVTGGSRGIGFAIAGALVARGARVAITGRNRTHLDTAAKRLKEVARGAGALMTGLGREGGASSHAPSSSRSAQGTARARASPRRSSACPEAAATHPVTEVLAVGRQRPP